MNFYKLLFCCFILLIGSNPIKACDCGYVDHFICKFIHKTRTNLAFMGKVIEKRSFDESTSALTVQIIKKYKEDYKISDTIITYGGASATCFVGLNAYEVGDTMIIAMGAEDIDTALIKRLTGIPYISKQFSQIVPFLCSSIQLKVKNGIVSGRVISFNTTSHLLEEFEDKFFASCEIPEIIAPPIPKIINCSSENINVYPNPIVENDHVIVFSKNDYLSLTELRVFTSDGKLLQNYLFDTPKEFFYIPKSIFAIGLNFIEVSCDNQRVLKRIVIPK